MREVVVAKSAGFCFGVQRAMDMLYKQIEEGNFPLYTYGPVIHNETVVAELAEKGVEVVNTPAELANIREGTVVIRTHGVGPDIYDIIEKNGIRLIDATCPFVKKIHGIVSQKAKEGYHIYIAGDASHPEVQGIVGWCGRALVDVISTVDELKDISRGTDEPVCLVSQTTFNTKKFQDLVEVFENSMYNSNVVNTICNATNERQEEARALASEADAMIVIGGRNSSNTRKLYEICKEQCENTFFIQTLEDFAYRRVEDFEKVGITAGASTPKNIIKEVQNHVRREF